MATATAPVRTSSRTPQRRHRRGPITWLREHIIVILAALAFVYLLLPNVIVIIFSFNKPNGRFNYTWNHFSTEAWTNICGAPGMCESLGLSLRIGIIATIGATVLGTLVAFALSRHRFRGRSQTNLLIFMPMATPEVVMGSSLLTLFINLKIPLGTTAILIAHVMFCLSFVVVTVKARIAGLDPRLEQAAADLYANSSQAFFRVTLPLLLPGIAAAALLSFSRSFDDYIITNFNSGSAFTTFPIFVYVSATRGIPPQANVIGSFMFLLSLFVVVSVQVVAAVRRRRR